MRRRFAVNTGGIFGLVKDLGGKLGLERERDGERGSRLRSTGLAPDRFHPIRYKSIRDDVVMIDDVTRSEVGLGWIHSVTSYAFTLTGNSLFSIVSGLLSLRERINGIQDTRQQV